MPEQQNTSFVPKKPLAIPVNNSSHTKRKASLDLFSIIAFIVLFISLILWGLAFLYKTSISNQINRQVAELKEINSKFDRNFVASATRLNNRIIATQGLIEDHVAPSQIFTMLEDNTLRSVSFDGFSFTYTEDGLIEIIGSGIADSFESVVLQSDQFGKNRSLSNVLFYGLQRDEENQNRTLFGFKAVLDPEFISYTRLIFGDGNLIDEESLELQTTGSISGSNNNESNNDSNSEPVILEGAADDFDVGTDLGPQDDNLGPFGEGN